MTGFIFGGGTPWTYDQLQRRRGIAEAMAANMGTPRNVGEGLASIGKALAVRGINKKADAREKELTDAFSADFSSLFNGGSNSQSSPSPGGGSSYADAIASIESAGSGDYSAVGPDTGKGRAYGKYQVMDFNIGPWTEKHLGKRMTPQEFLANPKAQDAVFEKEFGSYVQKHGNPQDAASMWFSGRPMAQAGNASDGYTTVPEYVRKFTNALGGTVSTRNAGSTSPSVAQIAQLLSNPVANPGQRAMLTTMLNQQMQANDPVRQMQLETMQLDLQQAQLDLEQDRNGSADTPSGFAELELRAKAAGLEPGTPEYQKFMLNGGGDPATFRALDMQARNAGFEPGTPEYAEFMATRGAGNQAYAKTAATNAANIETGGQAAEVTAEGAAQGKANVESATALREMERNLPGLLEVVDQLNVLADAATYTSLGKGRDAVRKQLGLPPSEGAIARAEYIAVVDNQVLPLLRQTFGAAFTAKEGETLKNTLGDPDKSPAEKKAVLNAFIEQKKRDIIARGGAIPEQAVAEIPTEAPEYLNEQDAELWEYYTADEKRAILNSNEYRGRK